MTDGHINVWDSTRDNKVRENNEEMLPIIELWKPGYFSWRIFPNAHELHVDADGRIDSPLDMQRRIYKTRRTMHEEIMY